MKGATSGAWAASTADAVAGPTPLSTVSSVMALLRSGSAANALRDADSTTLSSKLLTKSISLGLATNAE
ncbi:hypothetical protein TRIUR3_01284 [Triticum urartu]|uniref:Uncharacterized protein n=1 Tax=Triticum urartu TaxID=4572 RepID=M8A1F8_TRIUA|nr:hypothetical protein TRIUR3_01284 [Triticum urartu]